MVIKDKNMKKLYFLWDYDLTKDQVKAILHGTNETEKLWLISRIMTHAKFDDIWHYLHLKDIVKVFPKLRLPSRIKQNWQRALNVWGYHV